MTPDFNLGTGSNGLPAAAGRKAFIFYTTWYEEVCKSLDEQQQGEFLLTIVRYATDGTLPGETATPVVRTMFGLIRYIIDADLKKYELICAENRAKAEKSAAKRRSKAKEAAKAVTADNEQLQHVEPINNKQETENSKQKTIQNGKEKRREEAPVGLLGMDGGCLGDVRDAGQDLGGAEGHAMTSDAAPAAEGIAPVAEGVTPTAEAAAPAAEAVSRADVAAYWKERRYVSDWQEFCAFYEKRGWRNKAGEVLRSWKQAAVFWEDKFRRDVLPLRRREAEEARKAQRATQAAEAADIRREEREAREADSDRRAARAVSPELARHMYQRALALAQGNDDRAIDLLRRAPDSPDLYRQLCEGFR